MGQYPQKNYKITISAKELQEILYVYTTIYTQYRYTLWEFIESISQEQDHNIG